MSFLDFLANGTWNGFGATDDGSPGAPGTGQNISMQGMDLSTTQYVGTAANAYTLVIATDPNNPLGEALFLDDPVHANQNGVTGQPFLVGITTIDLTGTGPVLVDLTSTQFGYTPLTINGGDGSYVLLGNSGYDTFTIGNGAFDTVYVTENYNNIHAGDGIQDSIWTGANSSNDTLVLGNGEEDKIYVTSGSHDVLAAGNGDYDTLTVDGAGNSYDTLTTGNGWNDRLTIGDGTHNTLTAGNGNQAVLTTGNGDWNTLVAGNGFGDVLTAGSGSNTTLHAGNGDGDVLTIGAGNGNSAFAGNGNADVVTEASGNSNLIQLGNGAGDVATIGDGNGNTILGGTGSNAVLTIGTGNGNTIIVPNASSSGGGWGSGGDCGDGHDGGGCDNHGDDHGDNHGDDHGSSHGGSGQGSTGTAAANDILTIGAGNYNSIYAPDGANTIMTIGAGSHNYIQTGNGANDIATIGDGSSNTIQGGTGSNALLTIGNGNGNTIILPNAASSSNWGWGGDDHGDDHGGSHDGSGQAAANPTGDILTVGAGSNNSIYASDGANTTLVLGAGSHNYAQTGDGAGDVVYMGDGDGNTVQGGAGYDTIYAGNGEGNTIHTGSGGGIVYTGTGNDTVVGGHGNDTIVVGLHTETTSTSADPTHLRTTDGEAQHITLGSNGTDAVIIQGGTTPNLGTEVITAGAHGSDTFYFGGASGNTVIQGFNAAQDRLMLAGVTSGTLGSMPVDHFQYVHSAYSTDHNQNDKNDLLITLGGSNASDPVRTITLLNFASQDPHHLFNNTTINAGTASGLATLSKLFDFSAADQQSLLTGVDLSHQAHHFGV